MCAIPLRDDGLLVGIHTGHVLHLSRFGDHLPPRHYLPPQANYMSGDGVTCISVNQFLPHVFLVGYESGCLALFSVRSSRALTTYSTSTLRIKSTVWSNSRPSLFFVLDDAGCVHVWDLSESDVAECFSFGGTNGKGSKEQILSMIVGGSPGQSASRPSHTASSSVLYMAICHENDDICNIEGHMLDDVLSEVNVDELSRFEAYVKSL